MSNTTLGAVTLHDGSSSIIIENNCRKNSDLTIMPLYSMDSDETNVFDFGGTKKTIDLTGYYISDTLATIKTWVESVEALQQGHQDVAAGYPLTFTDDLRGTIKVKIINFESTYKRGEKSMVGWTLSLVQSSENA